jgi:hypothetical protein
MSNIDSRVDCGDNLYDYYRLKITNKLPATIYIFIDNRYRYILLYILRKESF